MHILGALLVVYDDEHFIGCWIAMLCYGTGCLVLEREHFAFMISVRFYSTVSGRHSLFARWESRLAAFTYYMDGMGGIISHIYVGYLGHIYRERKGNGIPGAFCLSITHLYQCLKMHAYRLRKNLSTCTSNSPCFCCSSCYVWSEGRSATGNQGTRKASHRLRKK